MRFQILIFCTILIFTIILTGCPGNEPTPNANSTNVPANIPNKNAANTGLNTTVKTPEATTNNAPTLTPVFKAYCDAMTKKDEAALRKIYSTATLKSLEADMKAENQKSLVKYLEADQVSNKLCEVRNEKIEGDMAIVEGKTEGAPNGFKYKFVKENGEWKLTNESPELDSVKKSASNSNTGK
jgi:hypothetical protein